MPKLREAEVLVKGLADRVNCKLADGKVRARARVRALARARARAWAWRMVSTASSRPARRKSG